MHILKLSVGHNYCLNSRKSLVSRISTADIRLRCKRRVLELWKEHYTVIINANRRSPNPSIRGGITKYKNFLYY